MFGRSALVLAATFATALSTLAVNASAIEIAICRGAQPPAAEVTKAFGGENTGVSGSSGAAYGTVCNDEYGVELTGITSDSSELNQISASATFPIAATAESVCPTMTMEANLWGYSATAGWVDLGAKTVQGVYAPPVYFFGSILTPGECSMGASFPASLLNGYSDAILGAHATQLSGTLIPVSVSMSNLTLN